MCGFPFSLSKSFFKIFLALLAFPRIGYKGAEGPIFSKGGCKNWTPSQILWIWMKYDPREQTWVLIRTEYQFLLNENNYSAYRSKAYDERKLGMESILLKNKLIFC